MIRRSAVTQPHRVLMRTDVSATPVDGWRFRIDSKGESIVLTDGGHLESWDALAPLYLSRNIAVVPEAIRRIGLSGGAGLGVVVSVASARGLWREVCVKSQLPNDGSAVTLEAQPKGDHLASELRIATTVVLLDPVSNSDPLAPAVRGARLWDDVIRVRLEGGRVRLPMEVISFRCTPAFRPFQKALFHVHVTGEPSTEIEQGLLVHLNADYPTFVSKIEGKDSAATAFLWDGIVRQVLRELLAQDMAGEEIAQRGTLGELARRWLQQAFSGLSVKAILEMSVARPAEFDACVAAWCGAVQPVLETPKGE